VTVNGQPVKPGRSVRAGERLRVRTEAGEFDVEILAVSEIRGPATAARSLYVESEEGRLARQREADQRRELHRSAPLPPGRPSGRDRRAWDRIRGRA
jgi:ribosome-associated heat shock protein Hsp15